MLYGKCKKVLKSIQFLTAKDNITSTFDIAIHMHHNIQDEDLRGCIEALERDGYLTIVQTIGDKGVNIRVSLTHKGRHYQEYRRSEIKEFLLKSVLTPIIVSIITTFITLWVSGIF